MTAAPLWTTETAEEATGGRCSARWEATGVAIDSRAVRPGDLFVALKGPNFDGHDFVAQALAEGAAAAMVDEDWVGAGGAGLPILIVDDTMRGLEALAAYKRARTTAKIIGVTGSVGKTGTKESLSKALDRVGETHRTIGNLNNHIGLPLTLARLPDTTQFAVIEMGMNHAGEIQALSKLARPDVAVITTVEPVHLEFFNSVEGIADAKAEIFAGMGAHGIAVLNRDNPHFERLRRQAEAASIARILSFGVSDDADIRLEDHSLHEACSAATVRICGKSVEYCIGAPGFHWVMNSVGVLGIIKALGLDPVDASAAFSEVRAAKGRGAFRRIKRADGMEFSLIDESYNASPASVRAAIAVLGRSKPKDGARRIAVLGDMLELGEASAGLHESLAKDLMAARIDRVYCCGTHMKALWEKLPQVMRGGYAPSSDQIADDVRDALVPGDVVMVKGSLGSKMACIIDALESRSVLSDATV